MPKYYFLTDSEQTFIIGPFITVCNDLKKYFGQVIRSNDYSEQYDLQEKHIYKYMFWLFDYSSEINLTRLQVKYKLIESLKKSRLHLICKLIGTFEGQIELSNPILEIIDNNSNIKYILELKISNGIICCPKLTIEFS
jgi:hypothetical protein